MDWDNVDAREEYVFVIITTKYVIKYTDSFLSLHKVFDW